MERRLIRFRSSGPTIAPLARSPRWGECRCPSGIKSILKNDKQKQLMFTKWSVYSTWNGEGPLFARPVMHLLRQLRHSRRLRTVCTRPPLIPCFLGSASTVRQKVKTLTPNRIPKELAPLVGSGAKPRKSPAPTGRGI